MNMINNGGEDQIDNGMMFDTYKANILRTCIVPVDVVVNVQIIEELSLMKNGVLNNYRNLKLMNYCKIYVVNSLVFNYM